MAERLPSWAPGKTRDSVEAFLEQVVDVPVEQRVACFDNDGTLWCERPTYVQFDFFIDVLKSAVREDPGLAEQQEFAALLSGDQNAIGELGLARIAVALTGLCEGLTPEDFTARAREFMATAMHPVLDRPLRTNTYVPMLELIDELRRLDFAVTIVTGGGTEFVRAVSDELYGVPPEAVVGTPDRVRLHRRRRPPGPAPVLAAARRRQRGRGQGGQHPDPARQAPDPRRRQLGR